ncbi:MAG: fumarylacetoacetate hydrolase family protein [Xanthobacteraceae bacterium]
MAQPWDDPRVARGMRTQLAKRRVRIDAGDTPLGWKVGFGAPAAMAKLGIAAPLVGFLMRPALLPPGGVVSLAGWTKPVAEPEIAVHMGHDLPTGADIATVKSAIAALGPAIELADLDRPPDDVEAILAGNIYQRHVVLGMPDASRAGGRTDGLSCHIMRGGAECARTDEPQAATGDILTIVRHVADLLAAFGERLRAGEVIITGSVVPPLFVEADEDGIEFVLEPIGDVAVRFRH